MKSAILLFPGLLFFTFIAVGQTPVYQPKGIAIHGYDPVSYFDENKPVIGNAMNSLEWNGATWAFATNDNLQKFKLNPEKYAPQYGGYCAFGASKGYLAETDPHAFTVVDGKLYLNYSLDVRTEWMKDIKERIRKADNNWETKLKLNVK